MPALIFLDPGRGNAIPRIRRDGGARRVAIGRSRQPAARGRASSVGPILVSGQYPGRSPSPSSSPPAPNSISSRSACGCRRTWACSSSVVQARARSAGYARARNRRAGNVIQLVCLDPNTWHAADAGNADVIHCCRCSSCRVAHPFFYAEANASHAASTCDPMLPTKAGIICRPRQSWP